MQRQPQTVTKEQELANLNFMKVVLMLIIVFYHSILVWGDNFKYIPVNTSSYFLFYLQQFTTSYHTRCFTMISGYLFFYLKHEKGKYGNFWQFFVNKAKRLLIPYFFVGFTFVVPLTTYIRGDSLWDRVVSAITFNGLDQLWFLGMLFAEFILFYLLDKFINKHNVLSFIVSLAILGIGYLINNIPHMSVLPALCKYFLYFWLGYKFRQWNNEKIYKIPTFVILLIFALENALYIISREVPVFSQYQFISTVIYGIMFIIDAPLAYILLQRLATNLNYESSKFYNFIKDKTFTVYLYHQQFVYVFIIAFGFIPCAELHALVVFILTFICSLIITLIMQSNNVTRFLVGEKPRKKKEKQHSENANENLKLN